MVRFLVKFAKVYNDKINSQQLLSSLPSTQWYLRSHLWLSGMHSPVPHWNSPGEQPVGCGCVGAEKQKYAMIEHKRSKFLINERSIKTTSIYFPLKIVEYQLWKIWIHKFSMKHKHSKSDKLEHLCSLAKNISQINQNYFKRHDHKN